MMITLGGITADSPAAATTAPAARERSVLAASISGIATLPNTAVAAVGMPQAAPNAALARVVAIASPPLMCPSHDRAALNSPSPIPEAKASSPMRTNRGTTVSKYEAVPPKTLLASKVKALSKPLRARYPQKPTRRKAKPTGNFSTISAIRTTVIIIPTINGLMALSP